MIFDLGCCCIVPSGGIYDFYAPGGAFLPDIYDLDNYTILSRYPSNQIIFGDETYLFNFGPIYEGRNPYAGGKITSYREGYYMNLYTGEDYSAKSASFSVQIANPMHLVGEERVWISNNINRRIYTDYFEHSGLQGHTGYREVGPDCRIEGDRLILTTGVPTSGAYVRWDLGAEFPPSGVVTPGNYDFTLDIPVTFDKFIVVTRHDDLGFSYANWYNPSRENPNFTNTLNGTHISYLSGIPFDTGLFVDFQASLFKLDGPDGEEYVHCMFGAGVSTGIEIKIVDNMTGTTIDDISGYSLTIKNLRLPYSLDRTSYTTQDRTLEYINPVDKTSLFYKKLYGTGYSFYEPLFTTKDHYMYRPPGTIFTGIADSEFFNVSQDTNYGTPFISQPMSITPQGFDSIPYYTGSVIIQRLTKNNNDAVITFGADGETVLDVDEESIYDSRFYNLVPNLASLIGYDEDITPIIDRLCHYSAPGINNYGWNTFTTSSYDVSKKLTISGGNIELMYSSPHRHWLVEYDIPLDEKKRLYEKTLECIGTGNHSMTWYATDLDDFNTDVNFPKICVYTKRDAPNAFSVLLPKQTFIEGTGQASTGIIRQSLSQNIKILYGPPKQTEHTIRTISGEQMGTFIPAASGTGGVRPFVSYTYNGVKYSSLGTPSGVESKNGRVYDFTFDLMYGDEENSEVFWEDTFAQNVPYRPMFNYATSEFTGVSSAQTNPIYSGLYYSPNALNTTAIVLNGAKHNPTNSLAALFIHSRNHCTGNPNINTSGETYLKLKIGDNIVYNERLYVRPERIGNYDFGTNEDFPVHGPFELQATELEQRQTMDDRYAAFVWFEKLYRSPPRPVVVSTVLQEDLSVGTGTGWKMHVSDHNGTDLWSISTSGEYQWEYSYNPLVQDSSDRFFYVNGFLMPYPNVTEDNTYSRRFGTGVVGKRPFFAYPNMQYSGAGTSWGFSHNGRSIIPGANQINSFVANLTVTGGSGNYRFPKDSYHHIPHQLDGKCIKNSAFFPEAPILQDWSGTVPTGLYYMITGLDPFFPSGSPPQLDYIQPHWLISTSGFDMSQYPEYKYVFSGVRYLPLAGPDSWSYDDIEGSAVYYVASGTESGGWY